MSVNTPTCTGTRAIRRALAAAAASGLIVALTATEAAADQLNTPHTDPAGTTSTYHLFTDAAGSQPAGLVVYFDGDGQYGHKNPT